MTATAATSGTNQNIYLTGGGNTPFEVNFGAHYTAINSALSTIFGQTGGVNQVSWDQGDALRFVPFTVNGEVTAGSTPTAPSGSSTQTYNGDFLGWANVNSTLAFGTNGTGAITDAYVTGADFVLTRLNIDALRPVPEPSTWMSVSAALAVAGWVSWRRAARSKQA